ncbi:DUF1345 domain-containing protein [Schumannella luteola]
MPRTTDAPRSEHRWPVLLVTLAALGLHLLLPGTITGIPAWVVPAIGVVVLTPLVLMNPKRLDRETRWSRWLGIGFALALTALNQVYVVQLIIELINNRADGPSVLLTALAVWITNVVAFGLVYWQLDLGGPVQRRIEGSRDDAIQDFRFPQQDNPHGQAGWHPEFLDYAYFSLSNMMAFSPTDVMPLSRRAKLLMAYQALVGFVLLALVIARSVNILTP